MPPDKGPVSPALNDSYSYHPSRHCIEQWVRCQGSAACCPLCKRHIFRESAAGTQPVASEGGSRFSEAQLVCLLLGLLRYPPGTPDRNRHIAAMIPGNHHPEAIARIIAQPATLILREGNR